MTRLNIVTQVILVSSSVLLACAEIVLESKHQEKVFEVKDEKVITVKFPCKSVISVVTEPVTLTAANFGETCAGVKVHNKGDHNITIACDVLTLAGRHIYKGAVKVEQCTTLNPQLTQLLVKPDTVFANDSGFEAKYLSAYDGLNPLHCALEITELIELDRYSYGIHCSEDARPCFEKRELFKNDHVYCLNEDKLRVFNKNKATPNDSSEMTLSEFNEIAGRTNVEEKSWLLTLAGEKSELAESVSSLEILIPIWPWFVVFLLPCIFVVVGIYTLRHSKVRSSDYVKQTDLA